MTNRFDNIRAWASERNLLDHSDGALARQMLKLTEEVGEIASAIARGHTSKAFDGIGDAVVVLTILAAQMNVSIEACIDVAWNEIKDRTGRTVDGIFVKDEV